MTGHESQLKADYLRQLYRYQTAGRYRANGEVLDGVIEDVDESGRLVIRFNGSLRQFTFKEVVFV
jgi:biotin-(acetyl-CoA carboxylase) ligase